MANVAGKVVRVLGLIRGEPSVSFVESVDVANVAGKVVRVLGLIRGEPLVTPPRQFCGVVGYNRYHQMA